VREPNRLARGLLFSIYVDPLSNLLLLLLFWGQFGFAVDAAPAAPLSVEQPVERTIEMESGTSEVLRYPSMAQVTASDSKTIRVRQANATDLVVSARKVGFATIRVWEASGKMHATAVRVVPSGRMAVAQGPDLGVVRVRLQIVEVSDKARTEAGVHWPQMLDFQSSGALSVDDNQWNLGVRFGTAQGWIRQLMENGWAKLLSQPDLLVVMGEEARFTSGGEVPFAVLTDSYGRLQQSIQWKQYGLNLKVRPETADGFVIRSDVAVEISDLAPAAAGQSIPSVFRRSLNTKVNSRDGETVFLSGLVRQADTISRGGVPVLSDIPILGILFRESADASDRSEVLIAMTLGLASRAESDEQKHRWEGLHKKAAP
jgi:Flp pilus assembly secretin CpaC